MHKRLFRMLVAGFSLSLLAPMIGMSGPGDGIAVGSWRLRPSISVDATFDSNVYRTDGDTTSDTFFAPEMRISIASPDDISLWTADAVAFLSRREYLSEDDLSFSSYGDTVRLEYGEKERWQFGISQSYRKAKDNDAHATDLPLSGLSGVSPNVVQDIYLLSEERGINQLAAAFDIPLSEKIAMGLGVSFSSVAYDEDADALAGLDTRGYVGRIKGRYLATDYTSVFLDLCYGVQTQENLDDQAESLASRIGIELFDSDKLTYSAGVGVLSYALPGESSETEFSFDVSVRYLATEKIAFRGGANNGSQLSAIHAANGVDYISGWASAVYGYSPTVSLSLGANYRRDNYINPVNVGGSSTDRDDARVEGTARIDYRTPAEWMKIYGEGSYALVDSSVDGLDYADTRVTVGVDLCY